jgi:hypothetical protein
LVTLDAHKLYEKFGCTRFGKARAVHGKLQPGGLSIDGRRRQQRDLTRWLRAMPFTQRYDLLPARLYHRIPPLPPT